MSKEENHLLYRVLNTVEIFFFLLEFSFIYELIILMSLFIFDIFFYVFFNNSILFDQIFYSKIFVK